MYFLSSSVNLRLFRLPSVDSRNTGIGNGSGSMHLVLDYIEKNITVDTTGK